MQGIRLLRTARRRVLTLILLLLAAGSVAALDGPLIAVLPFERLEVSAAVAQAVTGLFESRLVNSGVYTVLSQNDRARILEAQEASLANCTDEDCALRVGRLLAAEQILVGTVASLGSKIIINAKIIDVATSRTVAADSASAASVEGLEEASTRLTSSLIAAVPVRLAAAARTAAARPAGSGGPPGDGSEGARGGAETGKSAAPETGKGPARDSPGRHRGGAGRPALIHYLALPGALLLGDVGNLARSVGFELQMNSSEAYADYAAATAGAFTTLYKSYEQAYGGYLFNQILAYSFWGIGGASAAAAYFLFPPETYTLSRWGRVSFHAGLSLLAAGSILSLVSDNLAYRSGELWADYIGASAGDDLSALYDAYSRSYAWYGACRITSYSLWALGGLGVAGSFFLPGDREPVAPGRLNRILLAGGTAAIMLGGVTHSVAQSLRPRVETAEELYLGASGGADFDALYRDYKSLFGWYAANSVLSYVLWGGGAAAVLTSLFVRSPGGTEGPKDKGAARNRPEGLFLMATPNGLFLHVALKPKEGVE